MRRDSNICKELLKDRQKVKSHYAPTIFWLGTHSDPDCLQLLGSGRPPPCFVCFYIFARGSGFWIDAQLNAALWQFIRNACVCSGELF